ncbi:MAG: XRE family transcriptional regulator [Pantoea sp.]|uniref:XRE family transcriptional regulator n=1 Tax=Pantoea sp. TaxID=69393 RepID=UPI0039E216E2
MHNNQFFSRRLAAWREAKKINQEVLSEVMGFKDRQTLSAIEKGARNLQPEELMLALAYLDISFEEFADPYSLVGEVEYSWRQSDATDVILVEFEKKTNRLVALYRDLRQHFSTEAPSVIFPRLTLDKDSTLEEAQRCAEHLVDELALGEFPAENLESRLLKRFNILMLYIDAPKDVSGAAIRHKDVSVVLVNRSEVSGRRNFDIAHEVFHCLTWDALPPRHIEYAYSKTKKPHEERLADAFASALLMPGKSVDKYLAMLDEPLNELTLNALADKFQVSSQALKWRLVSLKKISENDAKVFDDSLMVNNGHSRDITTPRLYNQQFVEYVAKALDSGLISVRKMATVTGLTIEELKQLMLDYNKPVPFDL